MAPSSRGTYEPPSDDVHIFDGAEEDEDTEGSRLPLLIVIALFVLAAFGGVVWLAYTRGVERGLSDAPKAINAPAGPSKVAANGDEDASPYKGLKIYQQPAPADEEADRKVAPPPAAQNDVAAPETTLLTQSKPETVPPKPAETAVKPPPQVAAVKPAAAPPEIRTQTPAPEAVAPPAQLTAKPVPPQASGGAYLVQIGSYKSETEAATAWRSYQASHAGALSGYAQDVRKVDLGAKGTWYRLRVGSVADRGAAQALCDKLIAAGGGACIPTK